MPSPVPRWIAPTERVVPPSSRRSSNTDRAASLARSRGWRAAAALAAAVAATTLTVGAQPQPPVATARPSGEIRGLWVARTSLTSPGAIARMVADARASGFNTILVQVRGRGDAYYRSDIEPRANELASQPGDFDPLAATLTAARAAGLRVHAWINVNLVSSAVDLPQSRTHLVFQHPEWLMAPRALADELATVDPASPGYLGRLARWTRQAPGVEGLFTSPLVPEAASHVESVVTDLVSRYAVDGVHLDYVRFPDAAFDYSPRALAAFRASVVPDLEPAERQRLDTRSLGEVTIYADMFPVRWANYRRSRLTALVMRLRTAVKSHRPDAVFSAAVFPDATEAMERRLQDWRLWVENGLLDVVCPMVYTTDADTFASQVAAARQIAPPGAMWAGIGAYRLSPSQTIAHIDTARRRGAAGLVLFSYDSLVARAPEYPDYLGQVGRAAFGTATVEPEGAR